MCGPLSCLTQARYGIAWGAIGAAMACYDEVLRYAKERVVQGGPLAGKQITQEKLVFMLTEITQASAAWRTVQHSSSIRRTSSQRPDGVVFALG